MKRMTIFILILGLMLTFVIGCGDDDEEVVAPTTKETGELTDPDFLAVYGLLLGTETYSDSLLDCMDNFIDAVEDSAAQTAPGKLPGTASSALEIVITYHESSQYWHRHITDADTIRQGQTIVDVITVELEDSIQFKEGTAVVQWPDTAALTEIATGALLAINTQSGTGNVTAAQNITVVGEIASRGDITLNGTRSFNLGWSDQSGSCTATMDIDAVGTDIAMNITLMNDQGCPESGTLHHTGDITIGCTGDTTWSYSDTWTVSQVFYGDSTVVRIENSTTRWDYVDYCDGSGPVAKSFDEILAALKPRD